MCGGVHAGRCTCAYGMSGVGMLCACVHRWDEGIDMGWAVMSVNGLGGVPVCMYSGKRTGKGWVG